MPTTYGNDIVYCLKSHCGVRGYCRQKWVLQVQIICKFSNERTCKRNKDVQGLSCGFEVKYPTDTMTGITICIGVLFLLPGVFSLITYWSSKRNECPEQVLDSEGNVISGGKPIFPIVGLGSVILGLFLALMPATFVSILMYVLRAIS